MKFAFLFLMVFIFFGFGCSFQEKIFPPQEETQNISAQEAAEALDVSAQTKMVLEQTVFGLGGSAADLLGRTESERSIVLQTYIPNVSASLSWTLDKQVETEVSKAAQQAYEQIKNSTPIGEELPEEPKREYTTVTTIGSLNSQSLAKGSFLYPPVFWQEGEQGTMDDRTLLWLSSIQYEELVNTRHTKISLGLFEKKISSLQSFGRFFERARSLFQQQIPQETEETFSQVTADDDWGEFSLQVNGKKTTVRTIGASNWFGSYVILANPENPLVLEMHLNPLSFGSFEQGILESFSGYRLVSIE